MSAEDWKVVEQPKPAWADTIEGPCWIWQGNPDRGGYGRVGGGWLAHRVVYEREVGPIEPKWLTIDHLCRIKLCVNPAHAELVTREENSRRSVYSRGGEINNCGHRKGGNTVVSRAGVPTSICGWCFKPVEAAP